MIHIPMLLSASALLAPLAPTPVARMAAPLMQLNPGTQEMMYRQSMRNMDVRGAIAPTGAGLEHQVVNVQGGSLKTWSFPSPMQDQAHIILSSDGNPLDSEINLWHGPNNSPIKVRVYSEDGAMRPFATVVDTLRGSNTVAVRNTGQVEFPLTAEVFPDSVRMPNPAEGVIIQGSALRTWHYGPEVESVDIMLQSDGRPLNSRIELMQGPNNAKMIVEIYSENGVYRPFMCNILTPGNENVVHVTNSASVEFPMNAVVTPGRINGYGRGGNDGYAGYNYGPNRGFNNYNSYDFNGYNYNSQYGNPYGGYGPVMQGPINWRANEIYRRNNDRWGDGWSTRGYNGGYTSEAFRGGGGFGRYDLY